MTRLAPTVYGPRERIVHVGEPRLSDAECLALILHGGCRGASGEQIGLRLLREFGSLAELAAAEPAELAALSGVGPVRAAALQAAFGLARRLAELRLRPGTRIRCGADVARLVRESTGSVRQEGFFLLLLDARHRVQGFRTVSLGGLNSAPVHPREVFGWAVRVRAAAVVVAHNHPSGDATPSPQDREVTDRLRDAGGLLGIELLDHVVVGRNQYFSFADGTLHPLSEARPGSEARRRPGPPSRREGW